MSTIAQELGTRVDPDVFVSYRRTDKEFVERFVTALERQGPEVWWDADIGGGDDWRDSIVENLADSDCLVIVFSESCNASKQLVKELAVADHLNKVVIPIKIDDAEPKGSFLYELAWRNWINVHPDPMSKLETAAARIVDSLKEAGWTPPPADLTNRPPSPPPPDSIPTSLLAAPLAAVITAPENVPAPAPTPTIVSPSPPPPPAPPAPTSPPPPPPSRPAPPPAPASAVPPPQPSIPRATMKTASEWANKPRFDLKGAFPFHWADFIVPVLFALTGLLGITEGDSLGVALGDSVAMFAMAIALIGFIVFPIRYYRRRANPLRVARNLLISNIVFAVMISIGSSLTIEDFMEEGDTANQTRLDITVGFLFIASVIAGISFVIFFALSKARARRELHSHMQIV